jgi:hypothetical protein
MNPKSLAITLLSAASTLALAQAAKPADPKAKPPVPPAIDQMPVRFQPPVPGCTDCYYTVPEGPHVGAMGTTNNEKVVPPDPNKPVPKPAPASPTNNTATATPPTIATNPNDLIFSSGTGAWAIRSATPVPLYIGARTALSRTETETLTVPEACTLSGIDYTTTAGTITTLAIPLSLWNVTTKTKLADLPADWNSWKAVTYPTVAVNKPLAAGDKLQVRLTQPAFASLPANFQFTIKVSAHCLRDTKPQVTSKK